MRARRLQAVLAVAIGALALGVGPVRAEQAVEITTAVEAWYMTAPNGGVPGGPAVSPYPAGSLHVGVAAGQEESRSYVALDLGDVDPDAEVVAARLVLPVDVANTRGAESASVRICRAPRPQDAVSGSTAPPPPADCSLTTPAIYRAADATFEADLEPMLDVLDEGIAIVAAHAEGATWHVAFLGRAGSAPSKITAVLRLAAPDAAMPAASASSTLHDSGALAAALHPESVAPVPAIGLSAPGAVAPLQPPRPSVAGGGAPTLAPPLGVAAEEGFRYSVIFGLPLLLLVAVPYFGRALTAPVVADPARRVSGGVETAGR